MLLTRGQLARHRSLFWGGLICLAAAFVLCLLLRPRGALWPDGGTTIGLVLGVIAAAIIAFEMLLWPRKRFLGGSRNAARTRLWGETKVWMQWHIWLGLLSAPMAFMHSGPMFWDHWFSLPWVLSIVLMIVYISGIYGLWLQNWIPRLLLQNVSAEVPAAEIEATIQHHREDYRRRLDLELKTFTADEMKAGLRLKRFFDGPAWDFLMTGNLRSVLAADAQAMNEFAKLQAELAGLGTGSNARPVHLLKELEELCSLRRQLDFQRQLHHRLHSWLQFHFPVSVFLCFLLAAHILTAIKYL